MCDVQRARRTWASSDDQEAREEEIKKRNDRCFRMSCNSKRRPPGAAGPRHPLMSSAALMAAADGARRCRRCWRLLGETPGPSHISTGHRLRALAFLSHSVRLLSGLVMTMCVCNAVKILLARHGQLLHPIRCGPPIWRCCPRTVFDDSGHLTWRRWVAGGSKRTNIRRFSQRKKDGALVEPTQMSELIAVRAKRAFLPVES